MDLFISRYVHRGIYTILEPWDYLDFNLWAPRLQDFNSSRFWHVLAREYAWMLQKAEFQTDAMKGLSSGSNCSQPHLAATMLQHRYYHTDPHLCCPCYLECDILPVGVLVPRSTWFLPQLEERTAQDELNACRDHLSRWGAQQDIPYRNGWKSREFQFPLGPFDTCNDDRL